MTTNDTPLYRKEIVYDHEARDYACYLDGELVAYERTYTEGETTLDSMVYDLLNQAPAKPSEVPVSDDQVALVDDEDYPRAAAHSWHLNGRGYAITTLYNPKRTISLHRFVMQAVAGDEVDHQNGNKLDCRKANLRIATRGQNIHNRGKRRDGQSSPYKGVRKHNDCDRWEANIGINGRRQYLGLYPTEEEAAKVYDAAARRVYGDFAHLNFPDEAEVTLDQLVFDLISGKYFREPDGPSSPYPPQDVDGTPDPDPAPGRAA